MAREIQEIKKEINELVNEYMCTLKDRNMANTGWVLAYKGVDLEANEFSTGYVSETSHDLTVALGLVEAASSRLKKVLGGR